MKKFLAILAIVVITLTACNGGYQDRYVPSNQPYQVMTDPLTGQQQVLYSMNGAQYMIPYATFMGWYNMGGYGYVNSMYGSNRNYFGSYNRNSYNGWRTSSFRDTYRGPSRTYSNYSNNSKSYTSPSNSSFRSNSSGSSSRSSFGSSNRSSSSSSFGSSSRPRSSSSFGSRSSSSRKK